MSVSYLRVKFYLAVRMLVISPGSLGERFMKAYSRYLSHLQPDYLPEEMQADFFLLQKALRYNDGDVLEDIPADLPLNSDKAETCASCVLDLFVRLVEHG
jgi:hypothetical protein